MRWLVITLALACAAWPALAQDDARDRGVLQAFLEDNLSGAGRTVRITGFKGALSARATIDELTIADDTGVWLTLRGAVLDWSRAALLRGRLEVSELSAREILLPRLPQAGAGGPSMPAVEARPFTLPDLPVAVQIDRVRAGKLTIGEAVFGAAATMRLDGALTLEAGDGRARLSVARVDGKEGALSLTGAFSNASEVLKLDLSLYESADGVVANLLRLPGRPTLALDIVGEGPVSRFRADVSLASDGQPRLAGSVGLTEVGGEGGAPAERRADAELNGDIAPLFAPDLRPFFGPEISLSFAAKRLPDGRSEIEQLSLQAASLSLSGTMALAADGLPERFALDGRIAGDGPVVLPLSGPQTRLGQATIRAGFDAAAGDAWTVEAAASDFDRAGLTLGQVALRADGTISGAAPRRVTAVLSATASGIAHTDPALAQALGERLAGSATLDWQDRTPLNVTALRLVGAGLDLDASGRVEGARKGFPVAGDLRLASTDLSRFAPLLDRPVAGSGVVALSGSVTSVGGAFDVALAADVNDLATGIGPLDAILDGATAVDLVARRSEAGTELERLHIDNPAVRIRAFGEVSSARARLTLDTRLSDLGLVEPTLSGPATMIAEATWRDGAPVELAQLRLEGAGAVLEGNGTLDIDTPTLPARGEAALTVADLSAFAALAGRPIGGALDLAVTGNGGLRGGDFDIALEAGGRDVQAGLGDFDRLITGNSTFSVAARRVGERIGITALDLRTAHVTARASGGVGGGETLDFRATLDDLALLAPDFPGAVTAEGTAAAEGPDWRVALQATGPGGTQARIAGLVAGDGRRLDLTARGTAPLGLANSFIAPRSVQGTARYDLVMKGRPGLGALSGRVATTGARVSVPTLRLAVAGLDADATIRDGRANLTATGRMVGGGVLSVEGPVQLARPFDTALRIGLNRVALRDPALYQTTLDGTLRLDGALAAGGRLSGTVDLGRTEVQIPSSTAAPRGAVPAGLTHRGEPGPVRETRERAGLAGGGGTGGGAGGGGGLGLDLTIRAPNQIFLRGRGLDAELGGQLRLAGTTSDMVPIGRFDLIRGRLDILGKRLVLDEGMIRLQGAFDAFLRLVASSQAEDTVVQVVLEGPVSAPVVSFQSQPELPEDEVVARLLFGRGLDTVSPFQAAQLAAAVATLTGRGDGGFVGRLRNELDLDDIDVTTDAEGTTALRAGKYLTDNVYTDVTVDSAGRSEINLNLDLTPQVTLKGMLGSDGETGLGIFYERDY